MSASKKFLLTGGDDALVKALAARGVDAEITTIADVVVRAAATAPAMIVLFGEEGRARIPDVATDGMRISLVVDSAHLGATVPGVAVIPRTTNVAVLAARLASVLDRPVRSPRLAPTPVRPMPAGGLREPRSAPTPARPMTIPQAAKREAVQEESTGNYSPESIRELVSQAFGNEAPTAKVEAPPKKLDLPPPRRARARMATLVGTGAPIPKEIEPPKPAEPEAPEIEVSPARAISEPAPAKIEEPEPPKIEAQAAPEPEPEPRISVPDFDIDVTEPAEPAVIVEPDAVAPEPHLSERGRETWISEPPPERTVKKKASKAPWIALIAILLLAPAIGAGVWWFMTQRPAPRAAIADTPREPAPEPAKIAPPPAPDPEPPPPERAPQHVAEQAPEQAPEQPAPPPIASDGPLEGREEDFSLAALGVTPATRRPRPDEIESLLRAANGRRLREHYDQAAQAFREVLSFEPDHPRATAGLAIVHLANGEPQLALLYAQRLVRLRPSSGNFFLLLGDAYRDSGNPDMARRAWERAVELDDELSAARERLRSLP